MTVDTAAQLSDYGNAISGTCESGVARITPDRSCLSKTDKTFPIYNHLFQSVNDRIPVTGGAAAASGVSAELFTMSHPINVNDQQRNPVRRIEKGVQIRKCLGEARWKARK